MTRHLLTLFTWLLAYRAAFSHEYINAKCCGTGEYLKKSNNGYICTENTSKRVDVLTNETNFLEKRVDGKCVDVTPKFSVFSVKGGNIVSEDLLEAVSFSKCCPLNHIYNTVLHSCEERENTTHKYIKETFVKVGLPDCEVIVDSEWGEYNDMYGSLIDEKPLHYCVDENQKGLFTKRECLTDSEVCDNIRCVKKCCPDGQSFVGGRNCQDTYTHGLNLSFSPTIENPEDPFAIISNLTCKRIFLVSEKRYIFNLTKDGTFVYWFNLTNSYIHEDVNQAHSYCLEHVTDKKANGFFFFKCRTEVQVEKKFVYTLIPKILSCIFLTATISIYFILNETRSLFGKILINYCVAVLLLFSILTYAHLDLNPSDIVCKVIGYSLILSSTASFAWLNIMSCDIWWTFGCTKQIRQRRKELKKLLYYLLYGWGMPCLLMLLILLFSNKELLPYAIQPFVGSYQCIIENRPNNYGEIIFLRFPHFLIQMVNIILFFKTTIYCLRIKNEINSMNDTTRSQKSNFKQDKERFSLILKLAVIMGFTYLFDALSAFVDMSQMGVIPKYIEIFWDFVNCLQGVFIFLIFICKRRIYNDFRKKMRSLTGRNMSYKQSFSSTTQTSLANYKSSRIL